MKITISEEVFHKLTEERNEDTIRETLDSLLVQRIMKHYGLSESNIIGAGKHGIAFDLENKVMKITWDEYEYNAARKVKSLNLKHYVKIIDLKKASDDIETYYIISMEKVKIPSSYQTMMINKFDFAYDQGYTKVEDIEKIKFAPSLQKQDYKLWKQFIEAKKELASTNLTDLTGNNCGFDEKDNMVFFDARVFDSFEIDGELTILENQQIEEEFDKDTISFFMELPLIKKIVNHFQLNAYKNDIIGAGNNGIAFDFKDNKVLKITTKENEYVVAKRIKDIDLENYVKIFDVKKIKSSEGEYYYIIVMEKLTLPKLKEIDIIDRLKKLYEKEYSFEHALEEINMPYKPRLIHQQLCKKYYDAVTKLEKYKIHDLKGENCGFRKDGTLVFFDGWANGYNPEELDGEVIILENSPSTLKEWSVSETQQLKQFAVQIRNILSKKLDNVISYLDSSSTIPLPKQKLQSHIFKTKMGQFIVKFENLTIKNSYAQYDANSKTMFLNCSLSVELTMKYFDNLISNPKYFDSIHSDDVARERFLEHFSIIRSFARSFENDSEYLVSITHELIHVKQKQEGRAKEGILSRGKSNLHLDTNNIENEKEAALKTLEQQIISRPDIWYFQHGKPKKFEDFFQTIKNRIDNQILKTFDQKDLRKKIYLIYSKVKQNLEA